jgi:predicted NBD/HSP70 family sugar kinase
MNQAEENNEFEATLQALLARAPAGNALAKRVRDAVAPVLGKNF